MCQVVGPIFVGIRSPRRSRTPAYWTPIHRDYERCRIDMHTLLRDLGITTEATAA